ncbi:MAG: hypothetical protein ACPLZA_08135 [Thermodesulfovibrio sp.]|uniref:Uncharacterized protein n=2 Tax=Thermodesulfovibrio TaxID=28261 RepID=A0A2J6WQ79_9BACT|nr:MAG: hypothetical protein C0186_01015 [Thermodesulfovibrio aggregans]
MKKQIRFQCIIQCSSVCCGGATIVTLREIDRFYRFFPITVGFRKIYPFNSVHENYIKNFAIVYKTSYIIGDFIAGNRLKKRCRMLKNSLCSLHGKSKPLQCSVIPFSVTFPEELQDLVITERRRGAFKACKGFHEDAMVVWDGEFVDKELKENFYKHFENFLFQRELMERIFLKFEDNLFFKKFVHSQNGFFEVPIIPEFIDEICRIASMDKSEFIKAQRSLFIKELTVGGIKNSLFIDALNVLEEVTI